MASYSDGSPEQVATMTARFRESKESSTLLRRFFELVFG